jgi:2-dehydro-3-deoxygluconokinase
MMNRVLSIGECMLQMREERKGKFQQGFGGDSLNTALYLSRLGIDSSYLTALGDDPWSDAMVAMWEKEGVNTSMVRRVPGAMPGLYVIQNQPNGERRFSYWRNEAPARHVFDEDDPILAQSMLQYDWIYFTGVTLSLYSRAGRDLLLTPAHGLCLTPTTAKKAGLIAPRWIMLSDMPSKFLTFSLPPMKT